MPPIRDLETLLAQLRPVLDETEYGFVTVRDEYADGAQRDLAPLGTFREREGLSLVVEWQRALETDRDSFENEPAGPFRCLTLTVDSSLDAVGLTAAVATELARCGIAANVVAATYHDHVFVPSERADEAFQLLDDFSARHRDRRMETQRDESSETSG